MKTSDGQVDKVKSLGYLREALHAIQKFTVLNTLYLSKQDVDEVNTAAGMIYRLKAKVERLPDADQ